MNLQGKSDSDKARFKCLNMTVSTLNGKTGMLVPLEGIVQTQCANIGTGKPQLYDSCCECEIDHPVHCANI